MLNATGIRQIFGGCGFIHALSNKKVRCKSTYAKQEKSKQVNVDKVFHVTRQHKEIEITPLAKKTCLNRVTVKRCLDILMEQNLVVDRVIGKVGPNNVCTYRSVTHE